MIGISQPISDNTLWCCCTVALGLTAIIYAWAMFGVFEFAEGGLWRRLSLILGWILNSAILLWALIVGGYPLFGIAVGCLFCLMLSHIVFWWASYCHGAQKPFAAYADEPPTQIIQSGPYAIVRHPFYSAYILVFVAGALATDWYLCWLCPVSMLIIYFFTAVNEERQILTSEHEVDYRSYRNRTGLFLPKVSHCWNPNQRA